MPDLRLPIVWRVDGDTPDHQDVTTDDPAGPDAPVVEPCSLASEQVHGGDEVTRQVADAPSRPEAAGDGNADPQPDQQQAAADQAAGSDAEQQPAVAAQPGQAQGAGQTEASEASEQQQAGAAAPLDQASQVAGDANQQQVDTSQADADGDGQAEDEGEGEIEDADDLQSDLDRVFGPLSDDDVSDSGEVQPDGQQGTPGRRNTRSWQLHDVDARSVARAAVRLLDLLAEGLVGAPRPGDEEWDADELLLRRWTRRPLAACRMDREREALVLVLDTSESCAQQAALYSSIAAAVARRTDVELWLAPNAELVKRHDHRLGWLEDRRTGWPWRGRTIIFFGDFDGGDAVISASRHNLVYWLSCESRCRDTLEHSWCSLPLYQFRGRYIPCHNAVDFLAALRRIRP